MGSIVARPSKEKPYPNPVLLLTHRDPYNGVVQNPYNWVVYSPSSVNLLKNMREQCWKQVLG